MYKKKKLITGILFFVLAMSSSIILYTYNCYTKIKEIPKFENDYSDKLKYKQLIYNNEIKEPIMDDESDKEVKAQYKEIEGISNILIIGVDDRGSTEPARSDTIMILTLDQKHKKIKLTSIMRDAYVEIPGYSSQKINHAFAYGNVNLLMKTISQNFNIKLNKYAKINFDGFKELVNSIGGLDIEIKDNEELNELNRCILLYIYESPNKENTKIKQIIDKGNLLALREEAAPLIKNNKMITTKEYRYISETANFIEKTGNVHLNGAQLLAYSRMRHIGDGVYDRVDRQRRVVSLIMNKLNNVAQVEYPFIANKLLKYLKTNVEFTEILNIAYTVYKIDNFNIEHLQIPTNKLSCGRVYKNKGWVLLMDKEKNINIMHDFIFENKRYNESEYSTFEYENSEYYYYKESKKKKFKSYYH